MEYLVSSDENTTTCLSSHLTSFAVLFTGSSYDNNLDEQDVLALSYLTYIGLGVSVTGASLTILTYAVFP
jgi:Latrophilin/CL-1-like GPS domain.